MSVCRLFWGGSRFPGSGGLGLLRCQLGQRPEASKGDFILRNPEIVKPVPEEVNEEQI